MKQYPGKLKNSIIATMMADMDLTGIVPTRFEMPVFPVVYESYHRYYKKSLAAKS